jgi:hypothetical protein
MTPEHRHLDQTRQLLRLRELRRGQAEAQARQAREAQARALAAAQATQRRVAEHQAERLGLLQQLTQGHLLVRWASQAQACRDLIEDRLERAEYALSEEEDTLHAADRDLDHASASLRTALARSDAADRAQHQARQRLTAALEKRAEREDPIPTALPPGAPR